MMIGKRCVAHRTQRQMAIIFSLGLGFLMSTQLNSGAAARISPLSAGGAAGDNIQSALDALPGGGEVFLGPGTYVIGRPIVLQRDFLTLRGSGSQTILYLKDKANCPVVILGAPDRQAKATTQLRLADLLIDGNRDHQQVELWRMAKDGSLINNNGVDVRHVTVSVVENVTCCRCRSGGLVTSGGNRKLTIRQFTAFNNEFDGLACYETEESEFSGLSLYDNHAAGISLDLAFNNNVIDRATLTRNDLGIFMRHARDNSFKNLTIRGSRNHGVFIAQVAEETVAGWKHFPGTECTGNRFAGVDISNCGGNAVRINDVTCTNNLIVGETFVNNRLGGLVGAEPKLVKAERLGN